MGALIDIYHNKESICFKATVLSKFLSNFMKIFGDSFSSPQFTELEFNDQEGLKHQLSNTVNTPHNIVNDGLYTAAFRDGSLGSDLFCKSIFDLVICNGNLSCPLLSYIE